MKELATKLHCDLKRGYIELLKEPTTDIPINSITDSIELIKETSTKFTLCKFLS